MKNLLIKILLLISLFLPKSGFADSSVYTQNESESPVHELPSADSCSVITLHIRELAFSRKMVVKEIDLLESPVRTTADTNGDYEQQMDAYEQKLKFLQEKASSLRKQIDMKEQQLENCLKHESDIPAQEDPQRTQRKRGIE